LRPLKFVVKKDFKKERLIKDILILKISSPV